MTTTFHDRRAPHDDRADHLAEEAATRGRRQVGPRPAQRRNVDAAHPLAAAPVVTLGFGRVEARLVDAQPLGGDLRVDPGEADRIAVDLEGAALAYDVGFEPVTLAGAVDHSARRGLRTERAPEERLDQLEQLLLERVRRCCADAARVEAPAAVDAAAPDPEASGHHCAAGVAADESGEHRRVGGRCFDGARAARPDLGGAGRKQSFIDERLVGIGQHALAGASLAEVDPVAQDVGDPAVGRVAAAGAAGAEPVEPARDRARAVAGRTPLEDLRDDRAPDGMGYEPTVLGLLVAEGHLRAPMPAAFVDVAVDRLVPDALDAAAEEIAHVEQLAEEEVGGLVAAEVAAAGPEHDTVIGCDERPARPLDPPRDHRAVGEVAAEAVDLRDDQAVELATLDPLHEALERRLVLDHAGHVDVLLELADEIVAVALEPAGDRPLLGGHRQPLVRVALALTGDAHVAGETHYASLYAVPRYGTNRGQRVENPGGERE